MGADWWNREARAFLVSRTFRMAVSRANIGRLQHAFQGDQRKVIGKAVFIKIIMMGDDRSNITLNVYCNISFCDIFTNRTKK